MRNAKRHWRRTNEGQRHAILCLKVDVHQCIKRIKNNLQYKRKSVVTTTAGRRDADHSVSIPIEAP